MRIALTVDPLRPGQDENLAWLARELVPVLESAFLDRITVVPHQPAAWEDWIFRRDRDAAAYHRAIGDVDLIIGFELPPVVLSGRTPWIDIRLHPLRFDPERVGWSIRASFAKVEHLGLAQAWSPRLPALKPTPGVEAHACFTLQVPGDASLIDNGRLLQAEDFMPQLARVAQQREILWLVPHPLDRDGSWIPKIRAQIPNAQIWTFGAYQAMASMRSLVTVSSSTGFEAPHFGCKAEFLGVPPIVSRGFYPLADSQNWFRLARALP